MNFQLRQVETRGQRSGQLLHQKVHCNEVLRGVDEKSLGQRQPSSPSAHSQVLGVRHSRSHGEHSLPGQLVSVVKGKDKLKDMEDVSHARFRFSDRSRREVINQG